MGLKTIHICDRCGEEISQTEVNKSQFSGRPCGHVGDHVFFVARKTEGVTRVCRPQYKSVMLCKDCWEEFSRLYTRFILYSDVEREDNDGETD